MKKEERNWDYQQQWKKDTNVLEWEDELQENQGCKSASWELACLKKVTSG